MTAQWPCSECPKAFTRKGDLTRHSLLHTGFRPHICSECGKAFSQYSGLKTHMNVHTHAKPFQCPACPAAFGDPSSRARHRKETHSRIGAYCCPESRCKSTIKRRSAFAAHLRKHGMKYAGVNIDPFFSEVAKPSRVSRRQTLPPKTNHVVDVPPAQLTTYQPQPVYDSFTPGGMTAYPHDLYDMDLSLNTDGLWSFNSRSSSLSPPSLTSSSSASSSPSPSPLEFQDEPRLSLPYVDIAEANALYNDPSDAYTMISPVSQLMRAHDGFDFSKHLWA
ncbi:hypothetical protein C8R47DRAFT_467160 [Mycena vitilis]|nr:hypothetical protein C8R47DRAFT_467160 [Mycena vitilis]